MDVYLVQHAEAKPEQEDQARPLSDRGREEIQRVSRHARALGLSESPMPRGGDGWNLLDEGENFSHHKGVIFTLPLTGILVKKTWSAFFGLGRRFGFLVSSALGSPAERCKRQPAPES